MSHFINRGQWKSSVDFQNAFIGQSTPEPNTGCWLWTNTLTPKGYAVTFVRKTLYAHRVAWELANATQIPVGYQIDHICRVRCCVNPDHLRVVTPRENVLSSQGIAAANSRKTHCKHGHQLGVDNVYVTGKNRRGRICKTCVRNRDALRSTLLEND